MKEDLTSAATGDRREGDEAAVTMAQGLEEWSSWAGGKVWSKGRRQRARRRGCSPKCVRACVRAYVRWCLLAGEWPGASKLAARLEATPARYCARGLQRRRYKGRLGQLGLHAWRDGGVRAGELSCPVLSCPALPAVAVSSSKQPHAPSLIRLPTPYSSPVPSGALHARGSRTCHEACS